MFRILGSVFGTAGDIAVAVLAGFISAIIPVNRLREAMGKIVNERLSQDGADERKGSCYAVQVFDEIPKEK